MWIGFENIGPVCVEEFRLFLRVARTSFGGFVGMIGILVGVIDVGVIDVVNVFPYKISFKRGDYCDSSEVSQLITRFS